MTRIVTLSGRVLFRLLLPGLAVYLRLAPRTRVFIVCNDRVLVVKNWLGDGKWKLPGGGLHRHEDPALGVLRELHEETGILLDSTLLSAPTTQRFMEYGFKFHYQLFMVQLTDRPTTKPQTVEISQLDWLLLAELSQTNTGSDVLAGMTQLAAQG